jgi:hypothetical protein
MAIEHQLMDSNALWIDSIPGTDTSVWANDKIYSLMDYLK